MKPNGSLYIMNTTQNMPFIDIYLRDKLYIQSRIVWHYDSSGVQAKDTMDRSMNLYCFAQKEATLLMVQQLK